MAVCAVRRARLPRAAGYRVRRQALALGLNRPALIQAVYTNTHIAPGLKLLNNPEVTVRTRGVMEKCTYCVQRIRNAEIEAEREWDKKSPDGKPARERDSHGRPKIADGEILTACQQACPTAAITFGDLSDDKSEVIKLKGEPHNYGLLAELNTMPRTSYLAAIRNPNKNMPQGA